MADVRHKATKYYVEVFVYFYYGYYGMLVNTEIL